MKRLLASTALAMALAVPAAAQSTDGSAFMGEADASALHASNLIGARLYTSEEEVGDDAMGLNENWEDVGEIGDIVFGRDGQINAVLVDVGGFLGIGEKRVAVSMDQLDFVQEDGGDSYFIVVQASREQLENAPEFGADAEAAADDASANEDMAAEEGAAMEGQDTMAAAEGESDVTGGSEENNMSAEADAEAGTDDTSEEVAEAADAAGEDMEQAAEETGEAVENTAEDAGQMAENAGEEMEQAAEDTGEAVENTAEEAGAEMEEAAQETENAAEEAGAEMEQAAENAGEEVEQTAEAAGDEMEETAQEAENATEEGAAEAEGELTTEAEMDQAESAETAEAGGNAMAAPEVDREGYSAANMDELTADDVTGARVYDVNDEWIGEVSELLMTEDGQIEGAVVDVGGFLGIGEKPVKLSIDSLNIQRPADGGSVRIYIGASEDELKSMPEYDAG
ncbi:hypothetical protein E0K89_007230 [Aquicoccus sp. SCR17]|nr:hypothetical protein [Carideicomes alvinocaridis]